MTEVTFPDVFNIDAAGGSAIGLAIIGLWVVAWVFRTLIRALRQMDDDGHGA